MNRDDSFFDISAEEFKNETMILFRQKEINQMIEILCSDSKNNVLIVGESGVGKTYLIKYLAQQILKSEVPGALLKKKIKEINFISLLTGSKYRGQFEEKGVRLLKDLKGTEIILVLEDIHLMMNSGAIRGTSLDFINVLKPFLRDNSVQIIATTNGEEFKNTVERDNSLIGFFQKISINQMTEFETREILKYRASQLSSKHSLIISTELVNEIVKMAKSNIRNRMLPDSAVMLLERCVSKRVYKNFVSNNYEPELPVEILSEVLSDILNLPESFLSISIKEKLSSLRDILSETIKGQDEALDKLVKGVVASKLGFDINDNRPDGVFLFIGPTGVGKTQTAISLANALYGSDDYLIRLDMSEYMEKYTYSRFVGAAPGYVGYNDTNQLTDKVRKNPSSVILIDEVEKGDNQLLNIFLQIFDAGRLTDSKGNVVDFSNTTIIMTSNVGTDLYSKVRLGYQRDVLDKSVSQLSLNKSLKKFFSPEFLNRIDEIIVFDQLSKEEIVEIIRVQLQTIKEKMFKKGKDLIITDDVIELIATKGYSKEYGARNISRKIKIVLLEKIAELSLTDEWGFCDAVVCEIENDEIIIKLLKAEVHLEGKDVDSFKKMGSLNV
jgi:ATP-dependent Clp protease ATP-binding subunit ClpC